MKQIGLRSYQDIVTPEEQEERDRKRYEREIYKQEKAEYLAEERREREMFEKIYIFEVGTQSYNLCECCGEHNYCSLVSGKVYYV